MVYQEQKFGGDMHEFKLNEAVEGVLEEVREDVGKNKSNVYKVGGKSFWGTTSIDQGMANIKVGEKVRITLVDENFKFPGSNRTGRLFKVEVDR